MALRVAKAAELLLLKLYGLRSGLRLLLLLILIGGALWTAAATLHRLQTDAIAARAASAGILMVLTASVSWLRHRVVMLTLLALAPAALTIPQAIDLLADNPLCILIKPLRLLHTPHTHHRLARAAV